MYEDYLLYVYLVLALVSSHVRYFGEYVAVANTLIHEMSHAVFAILTGGKVKSIALFKNTEGVAKTLTGSWLSKVIVSYAGYTGSSAAAVGLYYLLSVGKYEWIIYFFIGITIFCMLFWMQILPDDVPRIHFVLFWKLRKESFRHFYGIVWAMSFIALMGILIYYDFYTSIVHISLFLSSVVLVQSVSSAYVIFKLSIKQRKAAGDATSLAEYTFIPAVFWGFIFFVQSLAAAYFIFSRII